MKRRNRKSTANRKTKRSGNGRRKSRNRKSSFSGIASALFIEALAVIAILAVFFGMRSGENQSPWNSARTESQEMIQESEQFVTNHVVRFTESLFEHPSATN